ncbi:cupin domain-containing protein [Falsiroseomonas sp. HW251]|uniref:cupin domain-containing protein n=1 Tax=Falsiroseomonas sp. HW251 TaxID=3390998 RepID=UPI003D316537
MDRTDWEAGLARDGFAAALDRRMEAGQAVPEHSHPFDARLLILDGEFILTCQGETRRYGPGESFELAANIRHAEAFGPAGATYLVGRRAPG